MSEKQIRHEHGADGRKCDDMEPNALSTISQHSATVISVATGLISVTNVFTLKAFVRMVLFQLLLGLTVLQFVLSLPSRASHASFSGVSFTPPPLLGSSTEEACPM
ncbi:hypothetical protein STEG23_029850 [Scotinomys teguina]